MAGDLQSPDSPEHSFAMAKGEEAFGLEQAVETVEEFLALWELPAGSAFSLAGRSTVVQYYPLQIALENDRYVAIVAGPEAKIIFFNNRLREFERVKQQNRTGQLRFSNESAMRAHLNPRVQQLAERWEYPVVFWKLSWYPDNTPGKGDSDRCGTIDAFFGVRPYSEISGIRSIHIVMDTQDGALLNYRYADHLQIESDTLVIPEAAALTAAQALATAHRPSAGAPVRAALLHIRPSGSFGSIRRYREEGIPNVRLAWVVHFEQEGTTIAIDAATGESLGGSFFR